MTTLLQYSLKLLNIRGGAARNKCILELGTVELLLNGCLTYLTGIMHNNTLKHNDSTSIFAAHMQSENGCGKLKVQSVSNLQARNKHVHWNWATDVVRRRDV